MKLITLFLAGFLFSSTGLVAAGEINITAQVVGGNTMITCTPAESGSIDKAYITVYQDGKSSAERNSMEISVDNKATYLLSGAHAKVEGRCRIFMLKKSGINAMPSREEADREVVTGEFSLEVK
ncbi:MAG: hypothetical protein ABFQ82_00330 [Thermodesulfobacteriota bacterium]